MTSNLIRRALLAGSVTMAASVVTFYEGRSLVGYIDPVGIPTVCYGHTATAQIGQTKTDAECQALLEQDLGVALLAVDKHLPDIQPETRAALGSFVYNVGEGAFRSSTLLKKAKAGDIQGACNELPRWKYAGGKVLNGLLRRREAEQELCLLGVKHGENRGGIYDSANSATSTTGTQAHTALELSAGSVEAGGGSAAKKPGASQ